MNKNNSIVKDNRTIEEKIESLKKYGVNVEIVNESNKNDDCIILGIPNIEK